MKLFGIVIFIPLLGLGCNDQTHTLDVSPVTQGNIPTVQTTVAYPNWTNVVTGVHIKQTTITHNSAEELFTIVRFAPGDHPIKIAVDVDHPKTLANWQKQLHAIAMINGGYFDENYKPTTQVMVDGKRYGHFLSGHTAMAYTNTETDPTWKITTADQIALDDAWLGIQSYPLLVDEANNIFTEGSDHVAQRTVLAQDQDGQIYFIVAEYGVLALNQLSTSLATQLNLPLEQALNLDGGPSTGIALQGDNITYLEDSAPVPVVLYIE